MHLFGFIVRIRTKVSQECASRVVILFTVLYRQGRQHAIRPTKVHRVTSHKPVYVETVIISVIIPYYYFISATLQAFYELGREFLNTIQLKFAMQSCKCCCESLQPSFRNCVLTLQIIQAFRLKHKLQQKAGHASAKCN